MINDENVMQSEGTLHLLDIPYRNVCIYYYSVKHLPVIKTNQIIITDNEESSYIENTQQVVLTPAQIYQQSFCGVLFNHLYCIL